jgi:Putative inner membrane exporter, YdcZ
VPADPGGHQRTARAVRRRPVRASAISFTIGAICLALVYRSGGQRAGDAPWWAWIGGALGAVFVTSVLADQYGWLSFEQKESRRSARSGSGC